ncbi:MAG: hypothetical protein AAGA77_09810 [Bacteroidota bacterium]
MGDFYFFTDPATLNSQNSNQAFGPVANSDSAYENGKDTYRITSLHTANNASAIAICDGTICIQENDSNSLNVIIKPDYQPPFDFPYINYFIYKGIRRDSLLSVGTNEIVTSGSIPFIDQIRNSWQDPNNDNPISESMSVLGINYKENHGFEIDGNDIFRDEDPIDHFFYYINSSFELPKINAGDKIGEFSSDFGIEIVLRRMGHYGQISLARTLKGYLKVDSISDPNNDSGIWDNKRDDASYFKHWHAKEKCLNYIDPCAFFGSFCITKIFYRDSQGNKHKCNSAQEIYDVLLKSFQNRNKAYLDIRNDHGYSLNYFKNYGDEVKFSDKDAVNESTFKSTRNTWPILQLEKSELASILTVKNNLANCRLAINCSNNKNPLIYYSKAYVRKIRKLKRKNRYFFTNKQLDFTSPTPFSFVRIEDNGVDFFLSQYYKVNVYDYSRNDNPGGPLSPSKDHFLNGVFRPLDLTQSISIRKEQFACTIWNEEILVNQSHYGGPSFIANIGVAEDDDHISFFAIPFRFIDTGLTIQNPETFSTLVTKSKNTNKMFLQEVFELFKRKEIYKEEMDINVNGNIEPIDAVVVKNVPISPFELIFRKYENPEDYVFLIFEKATFDQKVLHQFPGSNQLPAWLKNGVSNRNTSLNGIEHIEMNILFEYMTESQNKIVINQANSTSKMYQYAHN